MDSKFREERDKKLEDKYGAVKLPTRDIVSASLALPSLRRAMSKEDLNSKSILSEGESEYEESSISRSNSNLNSNMCISENTENRISNVDLIRNRPAHPSIRKLDSIHEQENESNSKIISPSMIKFSSSLRQKSEVIQTPQNRAT